MATSDDRREALHRVVTAAAPERRVGARTRSRRRAACGRRAALFATNSAPMLPVAPGLFSVTTATFQRSPSFGPSSAREDVGAGARRDRERRGGRCAPESPARAATVQSQGERDDDRSHALIIMQPIDTEVLDRRRGTGGADARRRARPARRALHADRAQGGAAVPAEDGALQRAHHGNLPPHGARGESARRRPARRRADGRVHRARAQPAAATALAVSVGEGSAARDRCVQRRHHAARALPAHLAVHAGAGRPHARRRARPGGVRCTLVERKPAPQFLPKMERCNARTMEIFRRMGLAAKVRAAGLPRGRADGRLHRARAEPAAAAAPCRIRRSPRRAARSTPAPTARMPLEPYQLISQYTLEPLLKSVAEKVADREVRLRIQSFEQDASGVTTQTSDGSRSARNTSSAATAAAARCASSSASR